MGNTGFDEEDDFYSEENLSKVKDEKLNNEETDDSDEYVDEESVAKVILYP